jgi:drug/metabolite transporter (DMT)-like permease
MVWTTEGEPMRRWVVAFAGGVLVAVIGAFLAVQGLDKADKWASVAGLFVGLAGLGLAAAGAVDGRRHAGRQSVTDSTIGGGVFQVSGVDGSVRIGPGTASATPPAPPTGAAAPSSAAPASAPTDGDEGQSVTRSSTAGPVRQVNDVGGDVELDR